MPHRVWSHHCSKVDRIVFIRNAVCPRCTARGRPGWRYTRLEKLAAWQNRYRLKPLGRHRWLAGRLFEEVTAPCQECQGEGICSDKARRRWVVCRACGGLRVLFTRGEEEIAAIRRRLLEAFPEALSGPVPNFPSQHGTGEQELLLFGGRILDRRDPFASIAPGELAVAINRFLDEQREPPPLSGRVFLPRKPLFQQLILRDVLLGGHPPTDDAKESTEEFNWEKAQKLDPIIIQIGPGPDDWYEIKIGPHDWDIAEIVETKWVVYCSVTDSMVSGTWGLCEFALENRGYLFLKPDEWNGVRILGAWEPAEDREARRDCVLRVYVREFDREGFPPVFGQWAQGCDPELLRDAILNVLRGNRRYWKDVFERLENELEIASLPPETLREAQLWSGAEEDAVRQAARSIASGSHEYRNRFRAGVASPEEERVVIALLLHCIQKDPWGGISRRTPWGGYQE